MPSAAPPCLPETSARRTFLKPSLLSWIALILIVSGPSVSAASDTRNWDSLSWSTVPRGVAFTAGAVGIMTMVVSGLVIADGVQEGCEKDYRGELTCSPDEEQVVSGVRWMGAGAILAVVGVVAYGSIVFIDRALRTKGGSEDPKEVPLRRTEEDVGNPVPSAP